MADTEREQLRFRSDGEWTIDDLVRFAVAVDTLYSAFLAAHVARQARRDLHEFTTSALDVLREQGPEPIFYDWYRVLRRLAGKAPALVPYWGLFTGARAPSPDDVLESLPAFTNRSNTLVIRRIAMASPGSFSFEGLGEVVKEIREFLKDLFYRNRQERQMGDLEILEKYLSIRRDNPDVDVPLPPTLIDNRKVLAKALEATTSLKRMESEQKLLPPGDNVDDDQAA